jgi:hypothetical protein
MSDYKQKMDGLFADMMDQTDSTRNFLKGFKGCMYTGYVANVPTERVSTSNGTRFLTFDVAVGTGRKKEGTDKWEAMYIQCAWFDHNQEIAKGDVVAVFGAPDITLLNGKAYPKCRVRHLWVIETNRGGSHRANAPKSAGTAARTAGENDGIPF